MRHAAEALFDRLEAQRSAAVRVYWKVLAKCWLLAPIALLPLAGFVFAMTEHRAGSALQPIALAGRSLVEVSPSAYVAACLVWLFAGVWLLGRHFDRRARPPGRDYLRNYQSEVFNHLCRTHFPGLQYDPKGYIPQQAFEATKLFPHKTYAYHSEDYFHGRSGKTDICFAEIFAQRRRTTLTRNGVEFNVERYFGGILFVADFHKHFHCTTRIVPRAEKPVEIAGQEPVTFEEPEFNEIFTTVSTDQTDVRYILSTSMVQRFIQLNRRYPGMRALFQDDRLVLALPSHRDRFEPSLHRPARSTEQINQFVRDIHELLQVVEELDLNTRIWSKN